MVLIAYAIPTMKSIGVDKSSKADEKNDVQEAVNKAKDAFEGTAKAGAAAAAHWVLNWSPRSVKSWSSSVRSTSPR